MIFDESSSEQIDLNNRLYQIVAENKISSLSMMSDMAGIDEKQIRSALEKLAEEGTLDGTFSSDGERFFLSEVTVSNAPIAPTKDEGYVIEYAESKVPKLVFISGILIMVAGYIVQGFMAQLETREDIGAVVSIVGLAVLIVGWFMISRANPPSNIK